jgi:hypothetical protein
MFGYLLEITISSIMKAERCRSSMAWATKNHCESEIPHPDNGHCAMSLTGP